MKKWPKIIKITMSDSSQENQKNLSFKEKLKLFQNLSSNAQQSNNNTSTTSNHTSPTAQEKPKITQDQTSKVILEQKQEKEQATSDDLTNPKQLSTSKDTIKKVQSTDSNTIQPPKPEQINPIQVDQNIKTISPQKSTPNEKELKDQENNHKESSQKQKKLDSKSLPHHQSNSVENEDEFNQTKRKKEANNEDLSIQNSNEEQPNDDSNPKKLKRKSAIRSFDNILPSSYQEAKDISDNIVIDFNEDEKVKTRMNEIRNGILNSTTIFDMKYLLVLKNSFVSFLKSIILDVIKKSSYVNQPNLVSKIYFFKTKEMSKKMEKIAEFIDQAYEEKNGKNFDDDDGKNEKNLVEMPPDPMLYVMTEKESFKEINIQITCENDLNSKIPQDF